MIDTKTIAIVLGIPLFTYMGYMAALELWCILYGIIY